ncbi:MAG TPA: ThiF family adenylyltransferase [Tepidisphaeraceae bacterium]|jgi:adenylyltransferase/sulfurtransferase
MTDALSISPADLADGDRFDRFKLIGWWDQPRLRAAKVLVIGAGALGNEIVKNLALLGIGNVIIADKDRIEHSNLSRSILYRAEDAGRPKAEVAARAAREIYPDMNVHALDGDVLHTLGAGVYRWADVVMGGLDNREARLAINRQCCRIGRPWIDGAIEVIQGVARVFVPDAAQENPCYECTMSERDWKLLAARRSCNLLTRREMEGGRTPTTPTIASIIAGVQCQELLKLLHGLDTLAGRGFVFAGDSCDSYIVSYQRKPDCSSHDTLGEIVALEGTSQTVTPLAILQAARQRLGNDAVLDFGRDLVRALACPACGRRTMVSCSLASLRVGDARCPDCDAPERHVETFNTLRGDEPEAAKPLAELGVPPLDILTARTLEGAIGYEIAGDAPGVIGQAAGDTGDEGLEWT